MNGFAQLARSVFPLAMVVVCSSIYFICFPAPRSEPTSVSSDRTSNPSREAEGNPPNEAAIPIQDFSVAGRVEPPSVIARGQRIESRSNAEPGEIVQASGAASTADSLAVQLATTDADLETIDSQLPSLAAQEHNASANQSSGEVSVGDVVSTEAAPSGTALPENVDDNRHYQSTRVNDYWVGLARARGGTPVADTQAAPGVVGNPYFTASVPTTFDSRQPAANRGDGNTESPQPAIPNRSSVVESQPDDQTGEMFASPARTPNPLQVQGWDDAPPMPMAASPAAPPAQRRAAAADATLVQQPAVGPLPPISDHVRQKLVEHWEYGGSLARRNATRLANQEFFSGLSLLAEHADQSQGTSEHLAALREGFLALEEVVDFDSNGKLRQLSIPVITQKHTTPLIREGYFTTDNHSQARTAYLLYAQRRIEFAVGAQPLAGELLYSLGKLALANYEFHSKTDNLEFLRAATLFQCALAVNPQHEKSANELAVIKAKEGDWQTARHFLQQAVVQRPDFLEAWQNLTKVHQRMGEPELARLAAAQVEFLSQSLAEQGPVRMVSNAEFAATAAAMDGNEEMVSQSPRATPNDNSGRRPRLFPALQE